MSQRMKFMIELSPGSGNPNLPDGGGQGTLRPGQVHVWYYDLDDPPPADAAGCLDAGERARADRFYRDRDGRRFRAAHCAFRHLAAGYLDCDPAAVLITRACAHCGDPKHGKPTVSGPTGRPIEINASHSDALGALAVALPPLRVGVDVERRRPDVNWAGILPDPADAEPPDDGSEQWGSEQWGSEQWGFEQWTRLEAAAKAAGTGLVRMPRLAPPGPDGWATAAFPDGGPQWPVRSLAAPEGYAAALAVSVVPAAGVELRWHR
jgi:4'-phosphopantetheinyl transferase